MPEKIVTFEDLLQALVNNFETHNAQHWMDGDLINAYYRGPKSSREIPVGKIAEHLQCSRQYVWHLCATAAFWPPEAREAYQDHAWSWFRELRRMPEAGILAPIDLASKYAGYSIRELRDVRTSGRPREDRERISITLLHDALEELAGGPVKTTARMKDGTQLNVTLERAESQ